MINETDLDWLARNVHVWPTETDFVFVGTGISHGNMGWYPADYCFSKSSLVTKQQWLALRAELQNNPRWESAPEWASWLGQDQDAVWYWHAEKPVDKGEDVNGQRYWMSRGLSDIANRGVLLGDWRDTLERRPADLSEQAVTARLQEATDNVLAAVPELKSDRFKFDPLISIEDNQEQDMKQDNGWFERGELPPVGAACLYVVSDRISAEVEITAHAKFGICFVQVGQSGESYVSKTAELHRFRPILTERDQLVEIITSKLSGTTWQVADAILAAGFKLEKK